MVSFRGVLGGIGLSSSIFLGISILKVGWISSGSSLFNREGVFGVNGGLMLDGFDVFGEAESGL